jgi:DNA-binding CsgD family transcriptional regulator
MRTKSRTLTPSELAILRYAGHGWPSRAIAKQLGLPYDRVKYLTQTARSKLGARNVAHALALAYRGGHLDIPDDTSALEMRR